MEIFKRGFATQLEELDNNYNRTLDLKLADSTGLISKLLDQKLAGVRKTVDQLIQESLRDVNVRFSQQIYAKIEDDHREKDREYKTSLLELETKMKNYVDQQQIEDLKRQLQNLFNANEDLKQGFESRLVDMNFKVNTQIKEALNDQITIHLNDYGKKIKHAEARIDDLESHLRDKFANT